MYANRWGAEMHSFAIRHTNTCVYHVTDGLSSNALTVCGASRITRRSYQSLAKGTHETIAPLYFFTHY